MKFGYFDNPNEIIPAFDPGLSVTCPICNQTLSAPMITISVMLPEDFRSYFYRTHKDCYNSLTPEQQGIYDSEIIDAVAVTKNVN